MRFKRSRYAAFAAALGCLVAIPALTFAGELRIAVAGLSINKPVASTLEGVTLTYTLAGDGLNVPGALQNVDISFTTGGVVKQTVKRMPGEAGANPGPNAVFLAGADLPAPGTYAVSVTANGVDVSATDFFEVSTASDPNLRFTNANGIDVNRVPGGVHHGLIYVSEGAAGTIVGSRATQEGVYVLKPDLTPMFSTPRATNADIGALGPWAASANSPFRITVAPDELVYITDCSDAHAGLFVATADVTNVQPLFAYPAPSGGSRAASGLVKNSSGTGIYGSTSSVWVEGTGATRAVYTTDEDLTPPDSSWLRTLPAGATSTAVPPGLVVNLTGSAWVQDAVRDSLGNTYAVSSTLNDARKFGPTGALIAMLPPNAASYYGVSIDESRDALFICTGDGRVFRAATAFTESGAIIEGLGGPVRDVATDAEGWVYALDGGNQRLRAFAAPGDYTVVGATVTAPGTLEVTPTPIPGDIAGVGAAGIYIGPNGLRYGDGKVDLLDALYLARLAFGLAVSP